MKRENTHQPDMDPSTKDVQKLQKGVKSILDDEIVFDDTADFKNNKEKIKLLAHALSSINECVSITDANNNLIFVNNAFVETYGFSREELIGNNIDDMVRGSNPLMDSTETIRAATIQGGWVGELVNKKKDGTEFPISLSTAVVHDDKNVPIALIGIASDITGRKKKEDQLRNSEESYRGLFNTILDAIYVLDKNGAFFDVNFGAEKMYGYKRNEFIGRTPEFLSAPGKNDFPKVVELIQNTFETGKSNSFEFWGLKKNGGIFPKIVTLHKGNYFGQDVIIAIARDITEQKKTEEALHYERELFIGGPVVTIRWRTHTSGGVKYVSPNVILVLGYQPEEMLEERFKFHEIIHPDDLNRILLEIKNYDETRQDMYEQEYRIKKRDGKYIWVHDFTKIKRNEENDIIDFHGYLIDITSRKEAEEALMRSEQELRKTNIMKDKFFSIVSHDLRSPFQGLIGMANILVEDEELTREERKEFTQKLYEGLKTQFNFIDGLLTWNRAQRGAIEFNPTINDLSRLIKETISLLNNSIENKELNLVCDLPENVSFNFDWNMIATVVRNLISNAIKFTRKGGNIKVIIKELPDSISCIVQDTGVGINQADLKKLWGVDTYYSTKGTDGEGGTGLGLILCQDFVEKHCGKISVESEVDKGSTFSFSLPKNKE